MKKRKNIDWVKLPVNLMDDARVCELLARKGMAGVGVYLALISEMYRRKGRCLTKTQIRSLKFLNTSNKTVVQVANDFGLFRQDQFGHYFSVIDFLGFEDSESLETADPVAVETATPTPPPSEGNACTTLTPPSPMPARINKDKDTDKDYSHIDGDGGETVSPEEMESIIRQIPKESAWTEAALMKSGFSELILRQWDETLRQFLYHALANCKNQTFCSVGEAMRYFHFYVTNATTGPQLRKALEEHERTQQSTGLYCHEDHGSAPGHRSYHGFPLPDDAPPRPDEQSEWDYEEHCWLTYRHVQEDKYATEQY
ncbi:MAG: Lin1244/Lin1753 domain-containing protein [Bacteroides sp.]